MAKGQEIKIGPWPDGINFLDPPDRIRDSQLRQVVNLEIDNTGVLFPRRGFRYLSTNGPVANKRYLAGSVTLDGSNDISAMIGAYETSPSTRTLFYSYVNDNMGVFTVPVPGLIKSVVQYQNKIWYIPANASSVGRSSPSNLTNTLTSVAAMPYGDYGFILKDRLFIVRKATSELFFSKATDFTTWAAPDGGVIQVNPGDNRPITKVVVLNNQIVIFKRDQTFIFSFTNNPTGDGTLRQVSADQGANDAITYNNEVYCFNDRSVFKFINGYFVDIGIQLNLRQMQSFFVGTPKPSISIFGKYLMIGQMKDLQHYVMNLDTGAWSTFYFSDATMAASLSSGSINSYDAATGATYNHYGNDTGYIFTVNEKYEDTVTMDKAVGGAYVTPGYTIRTKTYDFDDAETWKRHYSVAADIISRNVASAPQTSFYFGNSSENIETNDFTLPDGGHATGDFYGLIGPVEISPVRAAVRSFRFRRLFYVFSTDEQSNVARNGNEKVGLIFRSLRAIVGVKTSVSS